MNINTLGLFSVKNAPPLRAKCEIKAVALNSMMAAVSFYQVRKDGFPAGPGDSCHGSAA